MRLSIVIPVYDEEDNLRELHTKIVAGIDSANDSYEIIFVDDGSQDNSFEVLKDLASEDDHVKIVRLRRNFGQTAALSAGFDHAQGNVIITMDADLQNDPADIEKLMAKIDEGNDVVSGWRRDRKDKFFTRRLPSMIASSLISRITGLRLHDYGCALKAYRKESLEDLRLYGDMHRIIPAYLSWNGFSVVEMEVEHHPRTRGKSKYGLSRTFKVILDVLTAKFLNDFGTRPVHLFGILGMMSMMGGIGAGVIVLLQKFMSGVFAHKNPLVILAVFLFLLGMIFVVMGLLAELLMRTYYESQQKQTYLISDKLNIAQSKGDR